MPLVSGQVGSTEKTALSNSDLCQPIRGNGDILSTLCTVYMKFFLSFDSWSYRLPLQWLDLYSSIHPWHLSYRSEMQSLKTHKGWCAVAYICIVTSMLTHCLQVTMFWILESTGWRLKNDDVSIRRRNRASNCDVSSNKHECTIDQKLSTLLHVCTQALRVHSPSDSTFCVKWHLLRACAAASAR